MQIQTNTGHSVEGSAALTAHVETVVKKSLQRFEEHLTRVEVHLEDGRGGRAGTDDTSCTMEARPRNLRPVAVTHKADTVHHAVGGAAQKLKSSLETLFGRLEDQRPRPEIAQDDEIAP